MPLKTRNTLALAFMLLTSGCAGFGGVSGVAIQAVMGIPADSAIIRHGLIMETPKICP